MAYKCRKCGNSDVRYFGEMEKHEAEVILTKEKIAWGDKTEKTGKHLLVCLNPDCGHIGYVSDFVLIGD